MTIEQTVQYLLTQGGYKQDTTSLGPGTGASLYKRVDAKVMCKTNDYVSVYVELYHLELPGFSQRGAVVGLRHETQNGDWVRLEIYSVQLDELCEKLDVLERRVVRAWEAINEP